MAKICAQLERITDVHFRIQYSLAKLIRVMEDTKSDRVAARMEVPSNQVGLAKSDIVESELFADKSKALVNSTILAIEQEK